MKRVEVGPGNLFGADYSSKSQVANLILIEGGGGGITGNAAVSAERHYTGRVTPNASASLSLSRGPSTFNVAGETARGDFTEEGTDRWAIEQGYVSLMPLSLDLTDHAALARVQQLDAWKQLKFA